MSGDRHAFGAGYAASRLPPAKFEPVGISFVGASLSSPGGMEASEHKLRQRMGEMEEQVLPRT